VSSADETVQYLGAYQPSDRAEPSDSGKIRVATIHRPWSPRVLDGSPVVLWNTLQIELIVEELRAEDTAIRDEDLAHVRPLQHGVQYATA
jgi:Tn3 transposase DDE domain